MTSVSAASRLNHLDLRKRFGSKSAAMSASEDRGWFLLPYHTISSAASAVSLFHALSWLFHSPHRSAGAKNADKKCKTRKYLLAFSFALKFVQKWDMGSQSHMFPSPNSFLNEPLPSHLLPDPTNPHSGNVLCAATIWKFNFPYPELSTNLHAQ